jgi:predicted acyl esterase
LIQFQTAFQNPPHLICSAPWIKDYKTRYGEWFHGGIWIKERNDFVGYHFGGSSYYLEHPYCCDPFWNYLETTTDTPELVRVPMLLATGWFDLSPDDIGRAFYDLLTRSHSSVREKHRFVIGPWTHEAMIKPFRVI